MLKYAIIFAVISLIAGALGFGGIAAAVRAIVDMFPVSGPFLAPDKG